MIFYTLILVPKAHNRECQSLVSLQFPFQTKPVKVS